MTAPTNAPHIAHRIHLSALPEYDGKKLFGLSLCAAPYFFGPTDPPLLPNEKALDPYLPWKWNWRGDQVPAAAGFRWMLLACLKDAAGLTVWKTVPNAKVYGPPDGFTDDLMEWPQSAAGSNGANVHDTWWRKELIRLTVDGAGWKKIDGTTTPVAHAQQLERFYSAAPPPKTIDVNDSGQGWHPDSHPDLLGARMLRWATAHPPYNYYNRLAAAVECAGFPQSLATEYPDCTVPATGLRIAAVPLWVTDASVAPVFKFYESDPQTLIVEQDAPVDGSSAPTNFLRRSYGNIVDVKNGAQMTPGRAIGLDVEPWRKNVEDRLARCADLPMLLLEAAHDSGFAAVIGQRNLVEWIVDLSADLFQAASNLKTNPVDATQWAHQLVHAADVIKLGETETAGLRGVLALLPDSFQKKFPQAQFEAEWGQIKESLQAPLAILSTLETLAASGSAILRLKAQKVLLSLPIPPPAERTKLTNLATADASPRLLLTPENDLKFYRELRTEIGRADATNPAEMLVKELQQKLPLLGGAADLLERLLAIFPETDEQWNATRQILHDFLQVQRQPKLFFSLRAELAAQPPTLDPNPESDFVHAALRETLRFAVDANGSFRKTAVAGLSESNGNFPVLSVVTGLKMRLARRLETAEQAPQLPAPANAAAIVTSFETFLKENKAEAFRKTIYGDRTVPLSNPNGFCIVGEEKDAVFDSPAAIESEGSLGETAGALLFGRAGKLADLPKTQWLPLNSGVLRLREPTGAPGVFTTYRAQKNTSQGVVEQVIQEPLRPAVIQQRLSRRADYDNRPLVAASREDLLIRKGEHRPEPADTARVSTLPDFLFPARGAAIPALRYYGERVHYQFCWVEQSNACTLPPGCWDAHPALLKSLPTDEGELFQLGIQVTKSLPYLRRVGIGTVGVAFGKAVSAAGKELDPGKDSWPSLPSGIYPIAAELVSKEAERAPRAPLILLFPPNAANGPKPALRQAEKLVQKVTIGLQKPRTSDDNWERWVAADPSTPFEARRKVCAEAHRVRDQGPSTEEREKTWQPDDPALSDQCLIVFRKLYSKMEGGTSAVGFVRKWETSGDTATYTEAEKYFSIPFEITLERDPTLAPGTLVAAKQQDTFQLEVGVVLEMSVYALVPDTARALFAHELVEPADGPNSLGISLKQLLAGVKMQDTAPADSWLAVSPNVMRFETPELKIPSPEQAYDSLVVTGQGGKVCVGLAGNRKPADSFDLVHEVVVQEQIWRWNGKPSMPEDFDDMQEVKLPLRGATEAKHFAWDGIAFHHREDREHLATIGKVPLVDRDPAAKDKAADIVFTDDKESDARALYFRMSAQLRSRYFGAWPAAVQAGTTNNGTIDMLWKRYVLPHRLLMPLKKPAVVMVIPLLASGKVAPDPGGTAGIIAIVREPAFEQAGLAEKMVCELVESDVFQKNADTSFVERSKTKYFQAGYDPTLSGAPLTASVIDDTRKKYSPLKISGPVGLTFDQGSRDPLIVNSMFFLEVDRAKLSALQSAQANGSSAASHLFCQIRFRRTVRPGYEANGIDFAEPHPLASDWTDSQWVKFLPDSDLLRPNDGTMTWSVSNNEVTNWTRPEYQTAVDPKRQSRFIYFLCVTRHDLDALGRPATEFHSLHLLRDGKLETLWPSGAHLDKAPRLRGRVIEALTMRDNQEVTSTNWRGLFFPDAETQTSAESASLTPDVTIVPQSISAAYVIQIT